MKKLSVFLSAIILASATVFVTPAHAQEKETVKTEKKVKKSGGHKKGHKKAKKEETK